MVNLISLPPSELPPPYPCLQIEEIILTILSNLKRNSNFKALVAAALTCKRWSEISLDLLWMDIDLDRLLRVLSPTELERGSLRFVRRPTTWDWLRFNALAGRVRSLTLRFSLHDSLLSELSLRNQSAFFPRLQTLVAKGSIMADDFLPFINSSLRSLACHLRSIQALEHALRLLDIIRFFNPQLIELYLDAQHASAGTVDAIAELLRSLPHLRTLTLGVEPVQSILPTLAELPALEHLAIYGEGRFSSPAAMTLHSLKNLKIVCRKAVDIPVFLFSLVPYAKLTKLQLIMGPVQTAQEMDGLFEAIRGHYMLERLDIRSILSSPSLFDDMGMLQSCSALAHITISLLGWVLLTDEDVEALVKNFPKLVEFTLLGREGGYSDWGVPIPKTTLRVFLLITAACPLIEEVGLQINLSATPDKCKPHSNIKCINFQRSYLEDPKPLALFLSQLSPRPDELEVRWSHWQCPGLQMERWKEVVRLIPSIRRG
ncbi:hypothetical protein FRB95_014029 [Tulasnella sp. JGI-2019a]|nr:hypothetical protein FRB95_014029 [Tulasnella sp. JGI-2019a]